MCPLIAKDGSPWTGQYNSPCEGKGITFIEGTNDVDWAAGGCAWYFDGIGCAGCSGAHEQIADAANGKFAPTLGPVKPKRYETRESRDYDCLRASECQWQIEAEKKGGICPPRSALRLGLDPRLALF